MATSPVSSTTSTAAEIQQANKAAAQRLLTSLNAGSGVDVSALAQNLVDAERIPKENAINAKITKNESKISGLSAVMFMMNELKNNLAGLKDRSSYNTLGIANSTPTALNVTANTAASAGTYALNINSLAQPQRSMVRMTRGSCSADASRSEGASPALRIARTAAERMRGSGSSPRSRSRSARRGTCSRSSRMAATSRRTHVGCEASRVSSSSAVPGACATAEQSTARAASAAAPISRRAFPGAAARAGA